MRWGICVFVDTNLLISTPPRTCPPLKQNQKKYVGIRTGCAHSNRHTWGSIIHTNTRTCVHRATRTHARTHTHTHTHEAPGMQQCARHSRRRARKSQSRNSRRCHQAPNQKNMFFKKKNTRAPVSPRSPFHQAPNTNFQN